METKLWTALCALLLINFGSADGDHAAASPTLKSPLGAETEAPVTSSVPDSGSDPTSHPLISSETNTSSSGNSKMSNNTTTELISVTSEPRKDNATEVHVAVAGEKNETQRNPPLSQPSAHPTESPITHIPTSPADTSTSHHTSSADVTATPSSDHNNTSHPSAPPLSKSTAQSHQPSPTTTPSVVSSPTSEAPKAQATPSSTTTVMITTKSASTSSTSSSHVATTPASQSTSTAQPKTTSSPPSSPSTRTHADTPSQLNVGGDTKKDSPALDPLLAGLVSAFIITAVIITLLLFLKLRRRDNRPEFRRLQDLPMDDMMEDTPLSMYTY